MLLDATKAKPEGRAEFPRVSLKKDETARICILSSKDWEVAVRHFVDRMGYFNCMAMKNAKDELDLLKLEQEGGEPEVCLLCKMADKEGSGVSRPFRRFAIRVLRYGTNPDGRLTPGPLKYWMEIWIANNSIYRQLRRILEEWGDLVKHDLTLTCSDAQYQKISIDVKKDALWINEKDAVADYWKKERGKYKLAECLAQPVDEEALKRRLSIWMRRTSRDTPVDLEEESIFSGEDASKETTPGSAESLFAEEEGEKPQEVLTETQESKTDFLKELGLDED